MSLDYRWQSWATPSGVSPSALFEKQLGCGIYELEFANGDCYVGQSVHFSSRFASHRRRWDDIVRASFAEVPFKDLDAAEAEVINTRAKTGRVMRNLLLTSQPYGPSVLNEYIEEQVQREWLSAELDDDPVMDPERVELARRRLAEEPKDEQRIKWAKSVATLKAHPAGPFVIDSLAAYVYRVIPWPHQTEGRFWSVSAMPGTVRSRTNRRFTTLSIQNVEMLFMGEWLYENEEEGVSELVPFTVLNVHESTVVPNLLPAFGQGQVHEGYRTTGPIRTFDADNVDLLEDFFQFPEVLLGARQLAMSQLRKGTAMFHRHHNQVLADEIYARIGDALGM